MLYCAVLCWCWVSNRERNPGLMILAKESERRARNTHIELLEATAMQSSKASANQNRNLGFRSWSNPTVYLNPRPRLGIIRKITILLLNLGLSAIFLKSVIARDWVSLWTTQCKLLYFEARESYHELHVFSSGPQASNVGKRHRNLIYRSLINWLPFRWSSHLKRSITLFSPLIGGPWNKHHRGSSLSSSHQMTSRRHENRFLERHAPHPKDTAWHHNASWSTTTKKWNSLWDLPCVVSDPCNVDDVARRAMCIKWCLQHSLSLC
jgi:hypothetical protein